MLPVLPRRALVFRRASRLGVVLAAAFGALPAAAQTVAFGGIKADTSAPVEVTADSLRVDQSTGQATFAGNVLIGEAIHFGKPILALPEDAFEQRLNAYMIERMGVGMRAEMKRLTPSDVDRIMGNDEYYRSNMGEHARDGKAEAIATLLSVRDGIVPGTRNITTLDPEIKVDVATENREVKLTAALNDSFGFGGHNVALVFTA